MKLETGPKARYGKALFAIYKQTGDKKISEDVLSLLSIFAGDKSLNAYLADALVAKSAKKKFLSQLSAELKLSTVVVNFLSLLCDKGRASFVEGALVAFNQAKKESEGVVDVKVKTVQALTASQKKMVEEFVRNNVAGAKAVEIEEVLDASLIAGMRVRVGSVEHDMSVRGRLDALRTSLN